MHSKIGRIWTICIFANDKDLEETLWLGFLYALGSFHLKSDANQPLLN